MAHRRWGKNDGAAFDGVVLCRCFMLSFYVGIMFDSGSLCGCLIVMVVEVVVVVL